MMRVAALRLLLIAAAIPPLLGAFRTHSPRFLLPPAVRGHDPQPVYQTEFLPRPGLGFVHGATMAELKNGDLAVAWYAGSDEVMPDVSIYLTIQDHTTGRWSPARVIEDRRHAQRALRSRVKSIGNPVLYSDDHGLRLFYVAIMFGGWSGGTICTMSSPDGIQWTPARHVMTSPFLNAGMLVRAPPVPYDDGGLALPIYHELAHKWSAVARVDRNGRVIDTARVDHLDPLIQPWLVATAADRAVMFLRYSSKMPGCVNLVRSTDGGAHWLDTEGTPLVHRDSAVAAARLTDGSLLVFFNNTAWDRRDLSVARSTDEGVHWSRPHPIERDTVEDLTIRHEYSYPFALLTRDGRLHLVYTWQRTQIRHLTFNEAWVQADPLLAHSR
jgi:predicted neuraminidase